MFNDNSYETLTPITSNYRIYMSVSTGVKGRPKKRWREELREDMREKGLCRCLGQVKVEENVVERP